MKKIYIVLMLAFVAGIGVSCSTQESLTYFENADSVTDKLNTNDYSIKIIPDDELKIVISSQVPEATLAYNLPIASYASSSELTSSSTPSLQTYIVDKKGYITMPVLGKVHVEGKTTDEIADYITKEVAKDVTDPCVMVKLLSFKVNVLGEVRNPGTIRVKTERFSILDALAAVNDMTLYGRRENVLLIREVDGEKKRIRLNLNDINLLDSPYFYLQQNDVIYVEHNKVRKENSRYNQNNSFRISIASTIVSACSVIASLLIALVL